MVAHEKRNSAQLFCAVPTRNDLALSSLLFPAQPTQKLEYPGVYRERNTHIFQHLTKNGAIFRAFRRDEERKGACNPGKAW